jgi:hypothetical protein
MQWRLLVSDRTIGVFRQIYDRPGLSVGYIPSIAALDQISRLAASPVGTALSLNRSWLAGHFLLVSFSGEVDQLRFLACKTGPSSKSPYFDAGNVFGLNLRYVLLSRRTYSPANVIVQSSKGSFKVTSGGPIDPFSHLYFQENVSIQL